MPAIQISASDSDSASVIGTILSAAILGATDSSNGTSILPVGLDILISLSVTTPGTATVGAPSIDVSSPITGLDSTPAVYIATPQLTSTTLLVAPDASPNAVVLGALLLPGYTQILSGLSSLGKTTTPNFTLTGANKLALVVDNPPTPPKLLASWGLSQQNAIGSSGAVFLESYTGNVYDGGFLLTCNTAEIPQEDTFRLNLNWFVAGLTWNLYSIPLTIATVTGGGGDQSGFLRPWFQQDSDDPIPQGYALCNGLTATWQTGPHAGTSFTTPNLIGMFVCGSEKLGGSDTANPNGYGALASQVEYGLNYSFTTQGGTISAVAGPIGYAYPQEFANLNRCLALPWLIKL